jgi:hypothetical protein
MNVAKIRSFCAVIVLIFLTSQVNAQQSDKQQPLALDDYRVVQYISSAGYHPISIMLLDNNGDLLMACRQGNTREQLQEMNIHVKDSQIRLLEVYDLLSVEDGVLKTAFPILDPEQIGRIRAITKKAAPGLAEKLTADVTALVNLLGKSGYGKNAYSILFAYIVDGMIWSDFRDKELSTPTRIDAEHPFWAGEVWAFYPRRD